VAVGSVTLRVFVVSGLMAGVAGGLDLTKFGTTAISGHETDMLQALSAVIIGGTSLFGGRASMGGSIIAVFIPITLLTGFVMLGVPPFYQYMAVGAILIAAVYIDGLRRGRE
jgi:ribose transport system permease protein